MAIDCIRVLTNVTAPLLQDAHVHFVKYVIIVLQKNVYMDFKTGCTIIPRPTRRLMWLWKPERCSASRSLSTDHRSLRGHRAHNAGLSEATPHPRPSRTFPQGSHEAKQL